MPIGIAVTREQIDVMVGGICRDIHRNIMRGQDMYQAMQDLTDQNLTDLGYTQQEITDIRQVLSDMQDLQKVYRGAMALAQQKDFRASFKKVWGIPVS